MGTVPGTCPFAPAAAALNPASPARLFGTCRGDSPRDMRVSATPERADCVRCEASIRSADGTASALRSSRGRRLPRDGAGSCRRSDLPRRRGSSSLRVTAAARRQALALAPSRLVPDDEPLPPDHRGRAREPFQGNAPAELPLRATLQRALRPPRSPLPRPFPCPGRPRRRAPRARMRVRPGQRRARRHLRLTRGVAVDRRRDRRRLTRTRGRARARGPTSRGERNPLRGRSGAGSRERARPASSCGSASYPRR